MAVFRIKEDVNRYEWLRLANFDIAVEENELEGLLFQPVDIIG
jgi:hypothetical protein